MSGTLYTSVKDGDWGAAAVWSTDAVPNAATADVAIETAVTVAAGESFTTRTLNVASPGVLDLAGSLDVTGGATVDGRVSLAGGSLDTAAGLTLSTTASALGGAGTVGGSIENAGLIYVANGLLDLAGTVGGTGALEIDLATGTAATLELGQGGTEAVAFLGAAAGGVLELDTPGAYSGTISGFTFNDAIDLPGLAPGSLSESFSGSTALGTLTISNGTSTVAGLTLAGNYTDLGFTLVSDGHAGADVELIPPASETAVERGDWSNPAVWSAGVVPDNPLTQVNIPTTSPVTIAASESFVAGGLSLASGPFGPGNLEVDGSLSVAGGLTVAAVGSLFLGPEEGGPGSGFVEANSIDIAASGLIAGNGSLVSSGTLTK